MGVFMKKKPFTEGEFESLVDKTQDYSTGEVVIESLPQLTRADGL